MNRLTHERRLTPEEAAKYRTVRDQVAQELPELIARHHERTAAAERLDELVGQLKAAREEQGLSLADLTRRAGLDESSVSRLDAGERVNVTWDTLARYAGAVGKRLTVAPTAADG